MRNDRIIGMDVCGEIRDEMRYADEIKKDDQLNLEILKKFIK